MEYNYAKIGKRIKQKREEMRINTTKGTKKITQDEFIELINRTYYKDNEWESSDKRPGIIGRNTLSAIENGQVVTYDLKVIATMAEIFDCSIPYLFCETNCKSLNGISVHESTGLSESASDKLCAIWENRNKDYVIKRDNDPCHEIEMLSKFINDGQFINLMKEIYRAKNAYKNYTEYRDGLIKDCKRRNLSQNECNAVIEFDNECSEYKNQYEGSRYMLGLTFNEIIKNICGSTE